MNTDARTWPRYSAMFPTEDGLDLSWMERGACKLPENAHVDFFASNANPAKVVCATCPVNAECLEYAVSMGRNLEGVWAGTGMRRRQTMRTSEYKARSAA